MTLRFVESAVSTADIPAIDHNRRVLDAIVRVADRRLESGRVRSALEWCRVAACFAMTNSTGVLRHLPLEQVLDGIATRELAPSSPSRPEEKRRVLHVLSEAAAIGGLTRLVERWIDRDQTSISSVVITRQGSVADRLAAAARRSGGAGYALGADGPDSIQRAGRLRELAGGADFVICHLHSDDVVAALAFAAGYRGAPVAIYNHADHLFWLAPSSAVAVIDARAAGEELSRRGRAYPAPNVLRLALPIPCEPGEADQPRASLGTGVPGVVAVSVARPIKFRQTALEPHFAHLISAALDLNPQLTYVAVGAGPDEEPWPALIERFGDRVIAAGAVQDPRPYLAAADVYIDTYPFSSTTSLIEAASLGLPTLTLDMHGGLSRVFGLADFVNDPADRPTSIEGFQARLAELVSSPEARRRSGELARTGYTMLTAESNWRDQLEAVYSALPKLAPAAHAPMRIDDDSSAVDALRGYAATLLAIEQRVPLVWILSGSSPRFDGSDRAGTRVRSLVARALRRLLPTSPRAMRMADGVLIPAFGRRRSSLTPGSGA